MDRSLAALIVVISLAASATSARAEGLERCEALYVEARFDETRQCVRGVLARLAERPDAIRDAYALLAATEIAAERPPEAERALRVALAIDPGFEPENPLLRAPRVQELFARARPPERGPDLAIVPLPVDRGPDGELRFSVRAEGLRPPLTLGLRHRFDRSSSWSEDMLSPRENDGTTLAETTLPPLPAGRSLETRFVVETPDDVTVLVAEGPLVEAARSNETRSARPRAAPLRPRPAPVRRRARPRPAGHGSASETVWIVSAVSILATTVAVIVAVDGHYPVLFTIRM